MDGLVSNLTPTQALFADSDIGSILIGIYITAFIFYIIYVIAYWKIFTKAGEKGWKALIPIYNTYLMYKIVNMKSWFWYLIGISICAGIMMAFDGYQNGITIEQMQQLSLIDHPMTYIAIIGLSIIALIVAIILAYRTSKVFGHGTGFAFGLFFLPYIFWLILAYDKSKYDKKLLKK